MKLKQLITLTLLALWAPMAGATDLVAAQNQLNQGHAQEVYAQLNAEADTHAGDVDFDYVYGSAAVDSGHEEEAISVLERVLAINPQHAGARMELARAYYLLGADGLAEHEFTLLQQQNPPPEAKAAIAKYLAAIAIRKLGPQPQFDGYINAGIGYDSNITAVTSDFTGATQYTPPGNSILRKGPYSKWGGGFNYSHPFGSNWWDSSVDLSVKDYFRDSVYDDTELVGTLGIGQRFGTNRIHAGVLALSGRQQTALGQQNTPSTNNHTLLGISGDWTHDWNEQTQSAVQLQLNRLTFADVPVNDIRQIQLNASLTHAYAGTLKPVTSGSVYVGYDDAYNRLPSGDDYSRRNFGLRTFWQISPLPTLDSYFTLSANRRLDISAARDISSHNRDIDDTTSQLGLGAVLHHNTAWQTRLDYLHSHNLSSHPLYGYNRNELTLTVRYDFH